MPRTECMLEEWASSYRGIIRGRSVGHDQNLWTCEVKCCKTGHDCTCGHIGNIHVYLWCSIWLHWSCCGWHLPHLRVICLRIVCLRAWEYKLNASMHACASWYIRSMHVSFRVKTCTSCSASGDTSALGSPDNMPTEPCSFTGAVVVDICLISVSLMCPLAEAFACELCACVHESINWMQACMRVHHDIRSMHVSFRVKTCTSCSASGGTSALGSPNNTPTEPCSWWLHSHIRELMCTCCIRAHAKYIFVMIVACMQMCVKRLMVNVMSKNIMLVCVHTWT